MNTKLIIAGSRTFNDYDLVCNVMKRFCEDVGPPDSVLCGLADGADRLGERWAKDYEIPVQYYPANWRRHGKAAGRIRNKLMADFGTHLVAFWDGQSRGTKHMIEVAESSRLDVKVVRYDREQTVD